MKVLKAKTSHPKKQIFPISELNYNLYYEKNNSQLVNGAEDILKGAEMINMMKLQIDLLSGKSKDELQKLLDDMESVLDHNRDVYQNIKLDSINTEFSCRLTKYTF